MAVLWTQFHEQRQAVVLHPRVYKREEDKARVFSEARSQRTSGNGYKLKDRKFHLNVRKSIFYCKSDGTLEQIVQKGYEVSVLGDIQD